MNRLQTNKLITYLSPFHNEQTQTRLCSIASTWRRFAALKNQVRWGERREIGATPGTCSSASASLFAQPTREYIKASSLIYMRHGLLATDAGLILPAHNYTHQQHPFCMDDSQLQIHIFPVWPRRSDTQTTNSAQLPSSSVWQPNNLSDWKSS